LQLFLKKYLALSQVMWYNDFVDERKPINIYIFFKIYLALSQEKL